MIPLFTEHLWPWGGMSLFLVSAGGILYAQFGKFKLIFGFGSAAVLFLALGLVVVYLVPTDRKEIRKTVFAIAEAVKRNDTEGVLNLIDPASGKITAKAVHSMDDLKFETANITDYSFVRIDRKSEPLKAYVALNGSVRGTVSVSEFAGPFLQIIHFESVELVKSSSDGRWRVTDNCKFTCPGMDGGYDYY